MCSSTFVLFFYIPRKRGIILIYIYRKRFLLRFRATHATVCLLQQECGLSYYHAPLCFMHSTTTILYDIYTTGNENRRLRKCAFGTTLVVSLLRARLKHIPLHIFVLTNNTRDRSAAPLAHLCSKTFPILQHTHTTITHPVCPHRHRLKTVEMRGIKKYNTRDA